MSAGMQAFSSAVNSGKQMVKLKDKADASIAELGLLSLRHLKEILIVEVDGSFGGPIEHPDDMEQGALTGS